MKFNCGLSADDRWWERRKAARRLLESWQEWHDWFAWYPVRIGNHDCRWLEIIERRDTLNVYAEREVGYELGHKYAKPLWKYRAKENK